MILIADSGSTKTDWVLADNDGKVLRRTTTAGLNPYHLTDEEITAVLQELPPHEVHEPYEPHESYEPHKSYKPHEPYPLFFYGSGCTPEQAPRVKELLLRNLTTISACEVYSDMLGAARAVCGRRAGVACILGTGANSCLYDGERMVANTPALGYVLGDEGSGAVLGRLFLNALYKGRLPQTLRATFEQETGLTMSAVISKVYREPQPNRFLASLSLFIGRHLDVEPLRQLVVSNFRQFLHNNVLPYGQPDLPVGFVGSVAFSYSNELREAAELEGFTVGQIVKTPMEGLLACHSADGTRSSC